MSVPVCLECIATGEGRCLVVKSCGVLTLQGKKLTCILFKDPVRTAQKTLSVSIIKTSQLMLYREIVAVCSQIHTKHINTVCGQNVELLNVKLAVHIVTTAL